MFVRQTATTLVLLTLSCSVISADHGSPPWEGVDDTKDGNRVLEIFKLNFVKEKILQGLGLVSPPTFQRKLATVLRKDAGRLPLRPHSVHSPTSDNENKYSKVIVFAEKGLISPCIVPRLALTNSSGAVSFRVPRSPSLIQKAVLWYKTLENGPRTNESKAWICPCRTTGTEYSATIGKIYSDYDGCLSLLANDWDTSRQLPAPPSNRRGWNNIRLNRKWKYLLPVRATEVERRILFLSDVPLQVTDYKRPFLTLEVSNEIPKRRKRDAASVRDCRATTDVSTGESEDCCRSTFWVNVTQLGWNDWIISPSGFYFHYCTGRCMNGFGSGDSGILLDYTSVLNAHILKHPNFRAAPCCVPKKRSRLPIILTTDGVTINRTHIPQFIVDDCACMGFSYRI